MKRTPAAGLLILTCFAPLPSPLHAQRGAADTAAGGHPASRAQIAPLMTVLIKPGVMSEAVGKGDLDVTMTIPGMHVAGGAPFLSMGMFVPGLARPQVLRALEVRDDAGPVPVTNSGEKGAPGKWVSTRAVNGEVVDRKSVV